jgi:hypothetical protein
MTELKTNLTQDQLNQIHKLITFEEDSEGVLSIKHVKGDVKGIVRGDVKGEVLGNVWGDVWGNVWGDVKGDVKGGS